MTSGRESTPPSPDDGLERIGPYALFEVLGCGGMGTVFRARREAVGPEVAVKVLGPHMRMTSAGWTRFTREIDALDALRHPSVVHLLEHGIDGCRPWFAMELIDGPNLYQRICQSGPMDEVDALSLMWELSSALAATHAQGLIHRDVKPTNVLLGPSGVKLLDFGLVLNVERGDERVTDETLMLGTPGYAAPEGTVSPWALSARSDVYQLAETAVYVRTCRQLYRPHEVVDQRAHAAATDRAMAALRATGGYAAPVEALIRRSLCWDPRERPVDATELLAFFDDVRVAGDARGGRGMRKMA